MWRCETESVKTDKLKWASTCALVDTIDSYCFMTSSERGACGAILNTCYTCMYMCGEVLLNGVEERGSVQTPQRRGCSAQQAEARCSRVLRTRVPDIRAPAPATSSSELNAPQMCWCAWRAWRRQATVQAHGLHHNREHLPCHVARIASLRTVGKIPGEICRWRVGLLMAAGLCLGAQVSRRSHLHA